ncbi:unnamed protein product [Malassezia sympodialis ATCC 42132]|uniref:uncharacterized protein n=1 Tax=Malassezia sympodialis (strain ATCC 42132) TaxID=1230383 RepID=UPI0002C2B403|nr:uncharacterized protein MSY001_2460 [Malassezia sympodialis ATCC 42132]CCU99754.1 unnamed protein product [Malassezia sympodialis ATCC 42132]|eukprot:XP_018740986.1 uncharacterized protein MSY001_2460 [Malassezia sympodialis ATCC 42132]
MVRYGQLVAAHGINGSHGMHQFLTALERGVHIVNLDPANDTVPYPCAISLAELISVRDVMEELQLGPNGAMLYCMEYLEHNLDWLEARLAALEHDYVIFDLPGQVELTTNHPSLTRILERLQKQDWRDLRYLSDHLAETQPRVARMCAVLGELVEDFGLVAFEPLAVEDQASMLHLLGVLDRAIGYTVEGAA